MSINLQIKNSLVLGDDDLLQQSMNNTEQATKITHLPSKALGKDLKGFDEKYKQIKLQKKSEDFITEIERILKLFDCKLNSDILLFVLNAVEQYFYKPKSGEIKEQVVISIMKKYYNDDEELIKHIIKLVLPLIKKSTLTHRILSKATHFFLLMASVILQKNNLFNI